MIGGRSIRTRPNFRSLAAADDLFSVRRVEVMESPTDGAENCQGVVTNHGADFFGSRTRIRLRYSGPVSVHDGHRTSAIEK